MATRTPAPVDVPSTQTLIPLSSIDRAPAPVAVSSDPGIEVPAAPSVRPTVTQPAETSNPYPESAATVPAVPVAEQPVDTTPAAETSSVFVNQPLYLTVLQNGNIVLQRATAINFTGNGVSVSTSESTAVVNIVSSGGGGSNVTPGGSNTQVQFNDGGSFGGSSAFTFNKNTGTLTVTNITAPDGDGSVLINTGGVIGSAAGFNYDTSANALFVPSVTAAGDPTTGINAIYAGLGGYTVLGSEVLVQITSNANSYSQINQQNISNGTLASGDYIITANNGTDSTYYLDIGLAGSNHDDPDFFGDTTTNNDAYIYVTATDQAGPSSLSGPGNLIVGSTNGVIKLFVGNTAQANVIQTVTSDGISVVGNITTSSNLVVGPSPGGGSSILQSDSALQVVGEGANAIIVMGWAANQSSPDSIAVVGMNTPYPNGAANLLIAVGNNATTVNYWNFDSQGNTVFPTLTTARGDTTSGSITGYTLRMGDGAQEGVITTPDGDPEGAQSSQRLVINPGKGADGTAGEGGDIYLWAGRGGDTGGSGGDIKIRGGQGMGGGAGGYIRMEAGDSQSDAAAAGYIQIYAGTTVGGAPGYVDIRGGYNGSGTGGNITLLAGQGSTNGGDVTITGGVSEAGLASYGNVSVVAGASTWTFDNTGQLQAPGTITTAGNIIAAVIKTTPVAFASLPSAATAGAGARAFVTDGNVNTFASQVGGGGIYYVPVFSNGTDWYVG